MATQTQRALAQRAIGAAEFMEECAKWLQKEADDQNVGLGFVTNATVTLRANVIAEKVATMRHLSDGIRKLQSNLTKEKIRGRGHP